MWSPVHRPVSAVFRDEVCENTVRVPASLLRLDLSVWSWILDHRGEDACHVRQPTGPLSLLRSAAAAPALPALAARGPPLKPMRLLILGGIGFYRLAAPGSLRAAPSGNSRHGLQPRSSEEVWPGPVEEGTAR